MDLNPYIDQLREDLTSAAAAGDDQTRQTAAVLSGAIEPAARLAIMNALSDLAAEVTTNLDGQVVDLRLDGRDLRVVVSGGGGPATVDDEETEPPPPPPLSGDNGDISRITLRLMEEMKSQAEQAASTQGVSLNTFVAQAVQGALHGRERGGPWDRPGRGSRHGGRGRGHGPGHGRGRGGPWDGPGFGGPRGGWPGGEGGGSHVRGWVQG